jgi:hypothetical protein
MPARSPAVTTHAESPVIGSDERLTCHAPVSFSVVAHAANPKAIATTAIRTIKLPRATMTYAIVAIKIAVTEPAFRFAQLNRRLIEYGKNAYGDFPYS